MLYVKPLYIRFRLYIVNIIFQEAMKGNVDSYLDQQFATLMAYVEAEMVEQSTKLKVQQVKLLQNENSEISTKTLLH